MTAPDETPLSVVTDGSHSAGTEVEWNPSPQFRRIVAERDDLRVRLDGALAERDAARSQVASLTIVMHQAEGEREEARGELAEMRERFRAHKLSAAGDESELQHIHETLQNAYGREDLSEETAVIVDAMAAEWKRYRKTLENAREVLLQGGQLAVDVRRAAIRIVCDELDRAERAGLDAGAAPERWDASVPPGGYVCSACGTPVESEPCPDLGRAGLEGGTPAALTIREPEPGESQDAYKAYLDGLFAPIGTEVQRLREELEATDD